METQQFYRINYFLKGDTLKLKYMDHCYNEKDLVKKIKYLKAKNAYNITIYKVKEILECIETINN